MTDELITLADGSGGSATHQLVDEYFANHFSNQYLQAKEDQARIPITEYSSLGDRLAFTTDSYVVSPLFFTGGDIGHLAISGTVNDLAVSGAIPLHLSCGIIIEEGFAKSSLLTIVKSMVNAANDAGIKIVTGDTKVVPKGAADGIYINTSGIGVIPNDYNPNAAAIQEGDCLIVTGPLGNHGAAIGLARDNLGISNAIQSDCAPLNGLIQSVLKACPSIRAMRDMTRGGLVAVLNEFAQASALHLRVEESWLPIDNDVRAACELLGLDPLHLANEGNVLFVVPKGLADQVVSVLQQHPLGRKAAIVGCVEPSPPAMVTMKTLFGGQRILDMPVGELLPRIC